MTFQDLLRVHNSAWLLLRLFVAFLIWGALVVEHGQISRVFSQRNDLHHNMSRWRRCCALTLNSFCSSVLSFPPHLTCTAFTTPSLIARRLAQCSFLFLLNSHTQWVILFRETTASLCAPASIMVHELSSGKHRAAQPSQQASQHSLSSFSSSFSSCACDSAFGTVLL